jgi:hypothetical protein
MATRVQMDGSTTLVTAEQGLQSGVDSQEHDTHREQRGSKHTQAEADGIQPKAQTATA